MSVIFQYNKTCPLCKRGQFYSRIDSFNLALRNNSLCLSCSLKGRKLSTNTKEKLRTLNLGNKRTQEVKDKISKTLKSKPVRLHSEKTKFKLRLVTLNQLKQRGQIPSTRNYNPKACNFIDEINRYNGWNLQHALNGGEVELYGYFVDGYDKERNIILEYDEIHHERRDRRQKDMVKQINLLREIKPAQFWRYNEKLGKLYEVTNEN